MPTWSGTYTNELATLAAWPAKNGVRSIVDLGALGDVTLTVPPEEEDSEFSVWFINPNRNLLTIADPSNSIQDIGGPSVSQVSTRVKYGLLAFTYYSGLWRVSNWNPFAIPLAIKAAVQWEPTTVNGPATIVDSTPNVVSVVRTALGLYTITITGTIESDDIIQFSPYVIGLAAENNPEIIQQAMTATTLDLELGYRNKVGNYTTDDLAGDPANKITMIISEFP